MGDEAAGFRRSLRGGDSGRAVLCCGHTGAPRSGIGHAGSSDLSFAPKIGKRVRIVHAIFGCRCDFRKKRSCETASRRPSGELRARTSPRDLVIESKSLSLHRHFFGAGCDSLPAVIVRDSPLRGLIRCDSGTDGQSPDGRRTCGGRLRADRFRVVCAPNALGVFGAFSQASSREVVFWVWNRIGQAWKRTWRSCAGPPNWRSAESGS